MTDSLVIPVFVLCETSSTVSDQNLDEVYNSIRRIHSEILNNPVIESRTRLAVLGFNDELKTLVNLSRLSEIWEIPKFSPQGTSNFTNAIVGLTKIIKKDVNQLKNSALPNRVLRPILVVLLAENPDGDWKINFETFLNKKEFPFAPRTYLYALPKVNEQNFKFLKDVIGNNGWCFRVDGFSSIDTTELLKALDQSPEKIKIPTIQLENDKNAENNFDATNNKLKKASFPTTNSTVQRIPIPEFEEKKKSGGWLKKLWSTNSQKQSQTPPRLPEELPTKSKDEYPNEYEYTLNDNPIIGKPTTINAKPWWESKYWKVGEDEGFRELEVDIGTAGELAIVGATLRGSKHRYQGGPNQDSYAVLHDELVNRFLLVAVSDGVSNAKHSGYSSRKLVRQTVRAMAQMLSSEPEKDWSEAEVKDIASRAVQRAADNMSRWDSDDLDSPKVPRDQTSIYDLSATLTIAIIPVNPLEDETRTALVGFIGDSPCYLLDDDWKLLTPATKQGEILDHRTTALPLEDNSQLAIQWISVNLPSSSAFFIVTDGIGTSLDNGNTSLGHFLKNEWRNPCSMKKFLNTLDFDRQGEDDDRTVVAVWIPPFRKINDIESANNSNDDN